MYGFLLAVLVLDGTEVAVVHYGEGRDLDKVGGHLEPGVGLVEAVAGGMALTRPCRRDVL